MTQTPPKMFALFAEVSGSDRLSERLGDTEAAYALDRSVKRMVRSISGYGGRKIGSTGGELLVSFASAEGACQAAIDMQHRVSELPPVSGVKLTLRIGLHAGNSDAEAADDSATGCARRIAALAGSDQILVSTTLLAALPRSVNLPGRELPELGQLKAGKEAFALAELDWRGHDEQPRRKSFEPAQPVPEPKVGRLCIRYHGKAFLLDDRTPLLTLGRDPASELVIVDRKASRSHARIERRHSRYFYVDSSTNGSYVTNGDGKEQSVRRREIELTGNGRICFGTSGNDPQADAAEFEHL